jgi:hypothetical protein
MLPVNQVGRRRDVAQVVYDRDGRLAQLAPDLADPPRVGDRGVPAFEERERQIAHVKLGARAQRERVVGHQDLQPAHQTFLSTFSLSASASGMRCSL